MENFENIRDIINNAIREYPDNSAFIIKNPDKKTYTNITYTRFGDEINKLGTALVTMGLKDKRVAVIGKNRYEWALSYFAILNGLGVVVPLDKGLPENEIEISLQRSKADAIFFEEKYIDFINKIIDAKSTNVKHFICMDKIQSTKGIKYIGDLLELGKSEIENGNKKYLGATIEPEKTNIILFTSGTTDIAKAVELSHKNIASDIYGVNKLEKIYNTDVNMAFLPFHHTFGSTGLTVFLSKGATTVFCDGLRHVAKNLKEYKVTVFFCVPLILESMHKKIMQGIEKKGMTKKVKFGRTVSKFLLKFGIDIRRKVFKPILDELGGHLRLVINGAAAIDKNVIKDFNDFGILAIQGYGLTETSPVLTAENEKYRRLGSIGVPLCNVEIKIDNPNENGIGEIIVKGPQIMKGYYENEEATNEVLKNGWFHTGDLGYIDKDGFVFISGRKKNVIVLKNGKNVYPEELEILVSNLPYVKENMVFGVPKGEDVILAVKIVYNVEYVKEKYGDIKEEDLKEMIWKDLKTINAGLPNYKHIKNIVLTDEEMIKTTTNKVKRAEEIKKMQ